MELIPLETASKNSGESWISSASYTEQELILKCGVFLNNWVKAGYLRQIIEVAVGIELTLQNRLIYLNQYQPIISLPFTQPYKLEFTPIRWIPDYSINLYKLDMPLTFEPVNTPPTASTAISATVPLSTTSVSIVAANSNRKRLIVSNNSNQDMYLDFDATSSIADHTVKIPKVSAAGFIAQYEIENYTGVASAIWAAAGTGAALVREFN